MGVAVERANKAVDPAYNYQLQLLYLKHLSQENTMSNMSYVRFENTARDLRDCAEHIDDELDGDESRARLWLIETCKEILDNVGIEVDTHGQPTFHEMEEEDES